jgi:hypothetical protein
MNLLFNTTHIHSHIDYRVITWPISIASRYATDICMFCVTSNFSTDFTEPR